MKMVKAFKYILSRKEKKKSEDEVEKMQNLISCQSKSHQLQKSNKKIRSENQRSESVKKLKNEVHLSLTTADFPFIMTQWLDFHKIFDPNATLEDVSGSQNWWRTLLKGHPAIIADDSNLAQSICDICVLLLVQVRLFLPNTSSFCNLYVQSFYKLLYTEKRYRLSSQPNQHGVSTSPGKVIQT